VLLRHWRPEPPPGRGHHAAAGSIPPPVVAERDNPDTTLQSSLAWLGSARRALRVRSFFRARVTMLLTVLLCVLLWGAHDWSDRRARTTWQRPVRVALVLVEREAVPQELLGLLTARSFELERRLASEYRRHTGREGTPIEIIVRGPARASQAPPALASDGLGDLLRHGLRQWRWTSALDAQAHVELGFDSRVYLALTPTLGKPLAFVEGQSELGGRVGIAQADLDRGTIDFALCVVAHELLHTLGATDKYDDQGRTNYPQGFVEPQRAPLYPQPGAEVMARNVPLAPGSERPPETLDELYVGDVTARELGWR
jgi:hypothetical protein